MDGYAVLTRMVSNLVRKSKRRTGHPKWKVTIMWLDSCDQEPSEFDFEKYLAGILVNAWRLSVYTAIEGPQNLRGGDPQIRNVPNSEEKIE